MNFFEVNLILQNIIYPIAHLAFSVVFILAYCYCKQVSFLLIGMSSALSFIPSIAGLSLIIISKFELINVASSTKRVIYIGSSVFEYLAIIVFAIAAALIVAKSRQSNRDRIT